MYLQVKFTGYCCLEPAWRVSWGMLWCWVFPPSWQWISLRTGIYRGRLGTHRRLAKWIEDIYTRKEERIECEDHGWASQKISISLGVVAFPHTALSCPFATITRALRPFSPPFTFWYVHANKQAAGHQRTKFPHQQGTRQGCALGSFRRGTRRTQGCHQNILHFLVPKTYYLAIGYFAVLSEVSAYCELL